MDPSLYLARGCWRAPQISVRLVASTFAPAPALTALIDAAWAEAAARPDAKLFDGPVCRFEQIHADTEHLQLDVSVCSYKPFYGTNGRHPAWADTHGWMSLANAVGTSAALVSGDGWLVFGRRSQAVALYQGWAHPFGGVLEPREPIDLLAEMRRELHEEIGLAEADISDLACIGLVRDPSLRQPELLYLAHTSLSCSALEKRLDTAEHSACWCVRADADSISAALAQDDQGLTPVTRLVLQRFAEML